MLYFYLIPSFITGLITFSWYSYSGSQFFQTFPSQGTSKESSTKSKHNIPAYMWDIYAEGIANNKNSSSADVVKGITPKFLGPFFRSRFYPNHGKQEIEFSIPKSSYGETLVDAEIRLMTNTVRKFNISFQIFQKDFRWIFLDAKTVTSDDSLDWISLRVTQSLKALQQASERVTFLVVTVFNNFLEENDRFKSMNYLQPVLLLSYTNQRSSDLTKMRNISNLNLRGNNLKRRPRKRRNALEDYEEETNRIWEDAPAANGRLKVRNTCRRKPLYIEFSEIDYDTWIVAPTGYEAFQCVGKCTFPVSEHLSPTKHAIMQTLMHHVSPAKAVRACCVPTRLDPISVLYIDSKGILTYRFHYQDMVVAECGCR